MKTLLIADDEEINRVVLQTGFSGIYNSILAENGHEAIMALSSDEHIDAVLLDLNMPDTDGFEVLKFMTRTRQIHTIPVFVVTATEDSSEIQRAFNNGAVDVVTKPFNIQILKRRIENILELFNQRNNLEEIVAEKIKESKQQNYRLVEIMANMVEFRSKESGEHVKRVREYTKIILDQLADDCSEFHYLKQDIEIISFAACLHDIGKNSIPDSILGKPGKLTPEEFEQMKTHTVLGFNQLTKMKDIMDPNLYKYSRDIVRHHHERIDGKGYPDKLEGNNIPIWAQVVGIADVYDALTTERCYKKAYDHDTSVIMILNGECGKFDQRVIDAFTKVQKKFHPAS